MKLLLMTLLDGFAVTRDVYANPRKYEKRISGGFAADAAALKGDVRVVGNDVKSALEEQKVRANGQPSNARPRSVA
jgi:hypothetical protein